jgi:hypothetical protein
MSSRSALAAVAEDGKRQGRRARLRRKRVERAQVAERPQPAMGRQHPRHDAGIAHRLYRLGGTRRGDELAHFHADALRRQPG